MQFIHEIQVEHVLDYVRSSHNGNLSRAGRSFRELDSSSNPLGNEGE